MLRPYFRRRTLLLAALAAAGCACSRAARTDLQPLTAEGGSREFLVVEVVRQAHVAGLERMIDVSAVRAAMARSAVPVHKSSTRSRPVSRSD